MGTGSLLVCPRASTFHTDRDKGVCAIIIDQRANTIDWPVMGRRSVGDTASILPWSPIFAHRTMITPIDIYLQRSHFVISPIHGYLDRYTQMYTELKVPSGSSKATEPMLRRAPKTKPWVPKLKMQIHTSQAKDQELQIKSFRSKAELPTPSFQAEHQKPMIHR